MEARLEAYGIHDLRVLLVVLLGVLLQVFEDVVLLGLAQLAGGPRPPQKLEERLLGQPGQIWLHMRFDLISARLHAHNEDVRRGGCERRKTRHPFLKLFKQI